MYSRKVTHIWDWAFLNCESLVDIHLKASVPPIADVDSAFEVWDDHDHLKICRDGVLYVPKGSKSAYASDPEWSKFETIIEE